MLTQGLIELEKEMKRKQEVKKQGGIERKKKNRKKEEEGAGRTHTHTHTRIVQVQPQPNPSPWQRRNVFMTA